MKTLFLIRHAKSSWDDTALPDKDRPLGDRGRRDAPKMGKCGARLSKEKEIVGQRIASVMGAYIADETYGKVSGTDRTAARLLDCGDQH